MSLYTKIGDSGETMLYGGSMTTKTDLRIHACGTVDELDSLLGVILSEKCSHEVTEKLTTIQRHLYIVKADLATPLDFSGKTERVGKDHIILLEKWIDAAEASVPPLNAFVLPGGTRVAALLHQARTVCRRAERWVFKVAEKADISPACTQYLNRLGDFLFALARVANAQEGVKEVQVKAN